MNNSNDQHFAVIEVIVYEEQERKRGRLWINKPFEKRPREWKCAVGLSVEEKVIDYLETPGADAVQSICFAVVALRDIVYSTLRSGRQIRFHSRAQGEIDFHIDAYFGFITTP